MILKILTLGLFGGSKHQGDIRRVEAEVRISKFNRPSEEATRKVVKKFFKCEHEVDRVMKRLTSSFDLFYFDSEKSANGFFKALKSIGWSDLEVNICPAWDEDFLIWASSDKKYRWASEMFVDKLEKEVVSVGNVRYNRDDQLENKQTGNLVDRLSDLSSKEAIKYVTKLQKAA